MSDNTIRLPVGLRPILHTSSVVSLKKVRKKRKPERIGPKSKLKLQHASGIEKINVDIENQISLGCKGL